MASGDPVARWAGLARQASARFGIPANVLLGLIRVESGGQEGRTSSANAGGLTQFIPGTARAYGVDVRPGHARSQIFGAAKYLKALGFNRDPQAALAQYSGHTPGYAANVLGAARSYGSIKGGTAGTGDSGAQVLINAGGGDSSAGPDLGPGTNVTPAIAALLSAAQPQGPPISLPAAPAHSARAVMPQGYAPPSPGGPAVPAAPDVGALLDAVRTQGGGLPSSGGSGAGGGVYTGSGATSGGGGAIVGTANGPTARAGKIIGTPYTGTHTLGNWQSDRAYDIAVPKGTPMVALQDGTIVKVRHHPQDGGRFAGDQITVQGANGNQYFYAHGVASVKPGQRVRKGQELGVTGSANGVDHLHFGQMRGDPSMHLRRHS